MGRVVLVAAAVGLVLAALGVVPLEWVLAPLLGLAILAVGFASVRSFALDETQQEGPVRVDPARERVVHRCATCGLESLLLVRGAPTPPRHCGERMTEHLEVPGQVPGEVPGESPGDEPGRATGAT